MKPHWLIHTATDCPVVYQLFANYPHFLKHMCCLHGVHVLITTSIIWSVTCCDVLILQQLRIMDDLFQIQQPICTQKTCHVSVRKLLSISFGHHR